MQSVVPLACFLSIIRPPGVQYENALLQVAPVDKSKCPFVKDSSDIGFQLFTRHNPTAYQELQLGDDERLFASNMDFGAPTVFYFHAFMEQPDDGSGIMVREAYMQRGDTNVIMVDAHRLEAGPWYFTAAQNTWYIGRFAAAFIDYMVSRGLQLNSTQLVGHSLGAQAAGVAGSALTTGRVARITGLDPALPLFSGLPLEQRLDASDAAFVDVIHTDAGIFGYKEPIGHADFFPNGGRSPQPGCELEVVIPQQLLFNKCDGTEQTRGFYSYYLTSQSHTEQQHDSRRHYALKQIRPRHTGSKRKRVDSSRVETKELDRNSDMLRARPRKHLQKKSTIHIIEVHDVSHATPRSSRRRNKRDQRSGSTAVADAEHQAAHAASDHTDTEGEGLAAPRDHTDTTTVTSSETIRRSTPDGNDMKLPNSGLHASSKASTTSDAPKHAKKRQKRFLQLFSRSDGEDNFIFRALNFLAKNRKRVVPVVSVVRDISTLVRSANGELNHVAKETNQYVGVAPPPPPAPLAYSLELANESKLAAFVKRLLGLAPRGDRLTVGGG